MDRLKLAGQILNESVSKPNPKTSRTAQASVMVQIDIAYSLRILAGREPHPSTTTV